MLLLCLLVTGCEENSPTETPQADGNALSGAPGVERGDAKTLAKDKKGTGVVYSWVDENGRIHMASAPGEIPDAYRDKVVVTDTSRPRSQRLAEDRVWVIDMRREGKDGPLNYSLVDLDRLGRKRQPPGTARSPGELARQVVDGLARRARLLLGLPVAGAGISGRVILYTAPWCGFCKKAAVYLRVKGVVFIERDIESDRRAASELSAKLRRAGLVGGGVPVLDIGGKLVIGFDRGRIERLIEGL